MSQFKIYRNLHKNCFSVLKYNAAKKGYRLHAHVDEAILVGVKTKVMHSGRKRVIQERQKNVHAFIMAKEIIPFPAGTLRLTPQTYSDELYYNPYQTEEFINRRTREYVFSHPHVLLKNCKAYLFDKQQGMQYEIEPNEK